VSETFFENVILGWWHDPVICFGVCHGIALACDATTPEGREVEEQAILMREICFDRMYGYKPYGDKA